ncbi:MAG TPA: T9SS type A sorting domain-containing protein, partial [Flavisolibacter sp.]|nr:T9SS type A sorting domain-containing protein [Flavisolibacter sp.]
LMIGNDGTPLTEQGTDMPNFVTTNARRLRREWKIQRTGDPGPVQLNFDLTGIVTTGSIAQTVLIIDKDGDGNFTTGEVEMVTPSYRLGNQVVFENLVLTNNLVFTFITKVDFIALHHQTVQLKGKSINDFVQLEWTTNIQSPITGYNIEVSNDGKAFAKLIHMPVVLTTNISKEQFTEVRQTNNGCFYRIRALLQSQRSIYSNIICVNTGNAQEIKAYPSPFKENLQLNMSVTRNTTVYLRITDQLGNIIKSFTLPVTTGNSIIDLSPHLSFSKGMYFLTVTINAHTQVLKIIKN